MSATPSDAAAARDDETRMGMRQTFRRGLAISPEIRKGLGVTLALALVAASARATIPYLTQRVTDEGLLAQTGVNVNLVH